MADPDPNPGEAYSSPDRRTTYQVRIGDHGLRKADAVNWLVTRILTHKTNGLEYEGSKSLHWYGTLRQALECLYQHCLEDAIQGVELEHLSAAIVEARKTVCAEILETLPEGCEALSRPLAPKKGGDHSGAACMHESIPVREVGT